MWSWLKRLLKRLNLTPDSEQLIVLETEIQNLRLELNEQKQLTINLKQELERQRSLESVLTKESAKIQVEQLLTNIATPVTQLLTQGYLLEIAGKPIPSQDILTIAKKLIRALENHGLTLVGQVGEKISFDPNLHELLSKSNSVGVGESVMIKFVGVAYQGKVLRKAGVETCLDV